MIIISTHAADRFVERVMELDGIGYMSEEQYEAINSKIATAILPYIDVMNKVGYGNFNVDGIMYVLKNWVIVTIKYQKVTEETEFFSQIRGGAIRSGRKIKKMKRLSDAER